METIQIPAVPVVVGGVSCQLSTVTSLSLILGIRVRSVFVGGCGGRGWRPRETGGLSESKGGEGGKKEGEIRTFCCCCCCFGIVIELYVVSSSCVRKTQFETKELYLLVLSVAAVCNSSPSLDR